MTIESSDSSRSGSRPAESSHEIFTHSVERLRSETTSDLKTSDAGVDAWTFSLLDGRVRDSRQPLEDDLPTPTSGRPSDEQSKSVDLPPYSSRTSVGHLGLWSHSNWSDLDILQRAATSALRIWERPTADRARFYWPTPTAKANHWAPSMRKWPAYARLQAEFPNPSLELFEWMMALPREWTGSGSSEKALSLWWQQSRGVLSFLG